MIVTIVGMLSWEKEGRRREGTEEGRKEGRRKGDHSNSEM